MARKRGDWIWSDATHRLRSEHRKGLNIHDIAWTLQNLLDAVMQRSERVLEGLDPAAKAQLAPQVEDLEQAIATTKTMFYPRPKEERIHTPESVFGHRR